MTVKEVKDNSFDAICQHCEAYLEFNDYDWNYRNAEIFMCPRCRRLNEVHGIMVKRYKVTPIVVKPKSSN